MRPEEVLDLMRSAPERYDTARAALRYRGDGPTIKTLRERYLRSEAGRRETGRPAESLESLEHSEPDGPFEWRCRVWHVDARYWRRELDLPDGSLDIAASAGPAKRPPGAGMTWRHRVGSAHQDDPDWLWTAKDHYWTFYPFDPQDIAGVPSTISGLNLKAEGPFSYAGREAVRLVAMPVGEWEYAPEPLWWGADRYEFFVGVERGVLLRCASQLGGSDFDALEIEEIVFDERFSEAVFTSREPLPWR